MRDRSPGFVPQQVTLSELALSKFWADARLPAHLRLTDGRRVQVVYPGVWSNSNGPDFLDALIDLDGRLVRGHVEIHQRASDWVRHGHTENPAYDGVVLHVVRVNDLNEEARRGDGSPLPTLVLDGYVPQLDGAVVDELPAIFARLGNGPCLPTLGTTYPNMVRQVLRAEGWARLVDKQLRFSQSLTCSTASETLYGGLLDALGYSANRDGMAALAAAVPLTLLETLIENGKPNAAPALLLGVAGFLPLSPALAEPCGIGPDLARQLEWDYAALSERYALEPLSPAIWTLNRVRPRNHPAARLASLGWLVQRSAPDGLLSTFLGLPLDAGRSWDKWLAGAEPPIGASRRRQIIVNVFAPFLAAYADVMRDDDLAEEVADLWEDLPGAVDDQVTRAARRQIVGDARFPVKLALEEQGLHRIARERCRELRCFECPIAALAVEHEKLPGATTPERR